MITDAVIKEIYKKFKKPPHDEETLNLDYFIDLLKAHHSLHIDNEGIKEIVIEDLDEMSPFRRFLVRNLHAVLEFDKNVAFVFPTHILFLGKDAPTCNVHFKPDEPKGLFARIFGRK